MHGRPSGSTTTWPMYPALPTLPCSNWPPLTTPPPIPVPITTPMKSLTPTAPPHHASAKRQGPWRRCRLIQAAAATPPTRLPAGIRSNWGCTAARTVRVAGSIGPPHPTPHPTRSARCRGDDSQDQPRQRRPHIAGRRRAVDHESGSARNHRQRPPPAWCHRHRRRGSNESRGHDRSLPPLQSAVRRLPFPA